MLDKNIMKQELDLSPKNSIWTTATKWLLGIIAVVGFGVTIYLGFIKKTAPNLEYDILSETDFFNNSESASYIKIFIDSLDVQENHLNISTYRIRVGNNGNANVSYYDYDTGSFGLMIINGTLLEPPVLLESSTDYIRAKFADNDSIVKTSFINIPKLALDADDYFIVKLVILHESKDSPEFIPEGKISGQKAIAVNPIQAPQPDFWITTFSGSILVQVVRLFAYLMAAIVALVLTAAIISYISDMVDKKKRKKLIKNLTKNGSISKIVIDEYINNGSDRIVDLYKVYQNSEADITKKYQQARKYIVSKNGLLKKDRHIYEYNLRKFELYRQMLEDGYMSITDDGKITFNKEKKKSVERIYDILKNQGSLPKYVSYVTEGDVDSIII